MNLESDFGIGPIMSKERLVLTAMPYGVKLQGAECGLVVGGVLAAGARLASAPLAPYLSISAHATGVHRLLVSGWDRQQLAWEDGRHV